MRLLPSRTRLNLHAGARLWLSSALLVLAWIVVGCGTSADVDGIWRAETPPVGGSNQLLFVEGGVPGVELVVGTYGPDLSGLLRYYQTTEFETQRVPTPPWRECGCAFLHGARISGLGHVTFYLDACMPGVSPSARVAVRGDFNLTSDGSLQGTLTVDDPTRPDVDGFQAQLTFVRDSAVPASDSTVRACDNPATLADGNTGSGL